jgi:hypothetical protein
MFIREIQVSSDFSTPTSPPYVGQSGSMYWNNSCNKVTLFNGETGHDIYPSPTRIELTSDNHMALAWARKKMVEDMELDALCAKHPGLKEAKEAFDIMKALCK